jgi:hypothetical protein
MKKIYLSVLLAGITATGAVAQATQAPLSFNNYKIAGLQEVPAGHTSEAKALGVTFWTNDFTTPADWTLDNAGEVAPFGWNIGTTVNAWTTPFTGGMSTTGNKAELYNGDYNASDQKIGVTYSMTTATSIDVLALGGTDQVVLSWDQYGALFNDGQDIQVSTDGVSFTTVYTNNNHTTYVGNNPAAIYGNPETITVNIASAIALNPSTVWIRYTWTSRFPGNSAPVAWTTFGWFIDNVALTTSPDNDLTVEESYWGSLFLNYYQIPLTQVAPIEFTANARNNGINTQTDVQLNVGVNSGAWTGTSPVGVDIVNGAYDSLVVSTLYTPAALGNYAVTWDVSQNEIDDVPADNVLTGFDFDVTQYTYARDAGTADGSFFNSGELYILGNYYDIFADENVYSVDVRINSNTAVGSVVSARVYWVDPAGATLADALVLQDESDYHTIVSGNLGTMLNLDLIYGGLSGLALTAGETYFVAISTDGDAGASNDLVVGTAGTSYEQTSFLYDGPDDTWYYTTNTPMIRMNFDPASTTVGIEEDNQVYGVSVYPNPTSDALSVRYSLGTSTDVSLTVVDITGKTIASYNEGSKAEGMHTFSMNTAPLAEGVYYVTISTGESVITKKIVKK